MEPARAGWLVSARAVESAWVRSPITEDAPVLITKQGRNGVAPLLKVATVAGIVLPVVEMEDQVLCQDEIINLTGDSAIVHERISIHCHYAELLSAWTSRWLRTSKS